MTALHLWAACIGGLVLVSCGGEPHAGAAVYAENCAGCHEPTVETRAPPRAELQRLEPEGILRSLEDGSMIRQGVALSARQREAVAAYLGGSPVRRGRPIVVDDSRVACADSLAKPGSAWAPLWSGWGVDETNTRAQSAGAAGLSRDGVRNLTLKWAFGFEGTTLAYSQPAVAGDALYVGSATGVVYALDARRGCVHWRHSTGGAVRSAIIVARLSEAREGAPIVVFGDLHANVYALDAHNGQLVWRTRVDSHPQARITGAPLLHRGRLFVPVSSTEEMAAANPNYPCCTFRGSIVALDPATGRRLWKTHTMAELPRKRGYNNAGAETWGPSGAATWSTPTADDVNGALYLTTGNAYTSGDSVPAATNAIMALDQGTGAIRWIWQATDDDVYTTSCHTPNRANCEDEGPDFDFGGSAILVDLERGRRLLIAAQKSGVVHALDPDATPPRRVWQTNVGSDSLPASVVFGPAAAQGMVFVPYSLVARAPRSSAPEGGLSAIDLRTGRIVWRRESRRSGPCPKPGKCSAAHLAAPTWIPGVVLAGALDGTLRAYDARDGAILWEFDTARPFATVNGVAAHGGAINGAGPVVAGGVVYVNSGFAAIGMPGNVLLAFSVGGRR
jgi:polyvinyl alcohol dehydrogenase (cytochrome)